MKYQKAIMEENIVYKHTVYVYFVKKNYIHFLRYKWGTEDYDDYTVAVMFFLLLNRSTVVAKTALLIIIPKQKPVAKYNSF